MSKKKTFSEEFMPNELEIIGNVEDGLKTTFLDEELDPFEVDFNYDNCATINTNGMEYIAISRYTLNKLSYLVGVADRTYKEQFNKKQL